MKRLSPTRNSACLRTLRTSAPCHRTDLFFQPIQPRSSKYFFAVANLLANRALYGALRHSLPAPPHRSVPSLNLHRARVRRNRRRLPSSRCIESAQTHHARACALPPRASDTTLGLLGTMGTPGRAPGSVATFVTEESRDELFSKFLSDFHGGRFAGRIEPVGNPIKRTEKCKGG